MKKLLPSVLIAVAVAMPAASGTQAPPRSAKEGVYTTEQAGRGKEVYDLKCLSCHGSMATVTPDMAPLLNDSGFQNLWRDRSLAQLFDRIRETMPQDKPNTLTPDETAGLVAYILSANQLPAGETALSSDVEILKNIKVDAGEP
jgi:mono/diheme cytochrome c family protein